LDIRITVLQTINSLLPVSVGSFLVLFIIFLNIYLININAATFISFLYIFIRFQQAISGGSSTLSSIAAHRPYYDIAAQMLGELDKSERSQALKPTSQLGLFGGGKQYVHVPHFNEEFSIPQKLPPRIELNDVSFNYESNLEPVLSNISLVIPIGSQFAIVGPSGSGKSTLLSTILGMLEPTKGHVTIDDLPPDIFFRERNVRLGYVGAESFLIEGSIGENLRYGAPKDIDISDNACLKALQKAHLNDLIDSQPHFLEMQLNENGDGLSAGQKQRLGLARALLGKPQLLILDEVSANLDMDTELQIAKTVSELKGSCTTIIVSHRSGMLSFADSSFVLEIIWNSKRDQGPNNPPNQITTNQSYIPIEEK
jgi:ABC-type bacteriocin/lantibiotic exporter with double-glycine peptidase domain